MEENHGTTIIIAEDDDASRQLLARRLNDAGYGVEACANGTEALATIRRRGQGIIIADWTMPELDGLALCREIRKLTTDGTLGFVYFVLLTAHSEKSHIVAGLEAGADDYLTKPYHQQELLARLRAGERIYLLQRQLLDRQEQLRIANEELFTLNQQFKTLANTDVLTGLNNRRCLFDRFAETWSQTHRFGRCISCVMFDIDKFKLINDTHGHPAGDYVLREMAELFRALLRKYDTVGRIGGEEFCVVSPETDLEGAIAIANRLRSGIEAHRFSYEGTQISVTISAGVAMRLLRHTDPDVLMADADELLYLAKQNGRNQVWARDAQGHPQCVSHTEAAAH